MTMKNVDNGAGDRSRTDPETDREGRHQSDNLLQAVHNQTESSAQRMYGVLAPYYDRLGWSDFASAFVDVFFGFLQEKAFWPISVLDIACGTGCFLAGIRPRLPKARLCGVDLSAAMLAQARSNLASLPAIELYQGDMTDLPVRGRFDVAVCLFDAINHLLEDHLVRQAFTQVSSLLRPGGWYIFDTVTNLGLRRWGKVCVATHGEKLSIEKAHIDEGQSLGQFRVEAIVRDKRGQKVRLCEFFWERAYTIYQLTIWLETAGLAVEHIRNYDGQDVEQPEKQERVFLYACKQ